MGGAEFPSRYLPGPNYGGGNEDDGDLLQKFPCSITTLNALALQQATTDPRLCQRLLDTSGQVWVSLFGVTSPFSWFLVHRRFCLCLPRICFPVLCKFWQLYGGVNGDLLKEGLCHTHVCCTQSACPCSRPLLSQTSTGDT